MEGKKTPARTVRPTAPKPDPAERWQTIAIAAYFRAERRGFAPGGDMEDWLAAEVDVDALLVPAPKASGPVAPPAAVQKKPAAKKAPAAKATQSGGKPRPSGKSTSS